MLDNYMFHEGYILGLKTLFEEIENVHTQKYHQIHIVLNLQEIHTSKQKHNSIKRCPTSQNA